MNASGLIGRGLGGGFLEVVSAFSLQLGFAFVFGFWSPRKKPRDKKPGDRNKKPGDRNPGTDGTFTVIVCVARLARVVAVDVPHHVTQRGNARQYILDSDADRMVYLDLLRCHAQLHELSLVGYCLMSHHVHLVAIPVATGDSRVCRQHPRAFFRAGIAADEAQVFFLRVRLCRHAGACAYSVA